MARKGRTATTGNVSVPPGAPGAQDAFGMQGADAARGLIGTSLASLTGMVDWLEQMHALNGSIISGWSRALALCSRDLAQARDTEELMALPAQMVNHPLEQTSRQLTKALQDLFEAQARWADQWRAQMADQVRWATASAAEPAGTEGGVPTHS